MAKTRGSWLLKNRIPSRYRTPSHTLLPLTRYSLTLILTLLLFCCCCFFFIFFFTFVSITPSFSKSHSRVRVSAL